MPILGSQNFEVPSKELQAIYDEVLAEHGV